MEGNEQYIYLIYSLGSWRFQKTNYFPLNIIKMKVVVSIFFAIAVAVHVVGLIQPYTTEPTWSHWLHIVCYWLCLLSIWQKGKLFLLIHSVASIYPFFYHANCFYESVAKGTFSIICLLVMMMMPLSIYLTYKTISK